MCVVNVQAVTNQTVAHLAVILDIICSTTTPRKDMNVNYVILEHAFLSVCQDIGVTRVRLCVQTIALNVHQIQRVQVV